MSENTTNERNNSLFNEKLKLKYLEEMIESHSISSETAKSYNRIFCVTQEKEEELQKDLNQFSFEEIESILYDFKANNRNTVESYGRIISSYLKWSCENDLSKENVMTDMKPDDFNKYLTNEEEYITEKQLRRYEDLCENYQDAVILRLLFQGASGKQMSEVRNLKKDNIDYDNQRIKLMNTLQDVKGIPTKFTERWIDVSDRTLTLIKGACAQKTYLKRNGDLNQTANNNVRPYTDLVNNEYVVRASITKTDNWNIPVDRFVIYRRVQMIGEVLGIDTLTPKLLQRSGMIYQAKLAIQNTGEISLDDLKIVADRYNMKSYHNLKGFLTVENINKTYPDII